MPDIDDKIGLVELLDRALKKGVLLNADLIITVADVPLLAANLRLALASVETMLRYGIMNDWLAAVSLNKGGNKPIEMSEIATRNLPASAQSKRAISEHAQEDAPGFSPMVLDVIEVKNKE